MPSVNVSFAYPALGLCDNLLGVRACGVMLFQQLVLRAAGVFIELLSEEKLFQSSAGSSA